MTLDATENYTWPSCIQYKIKLFLLAAYEQQQPKRQIYLRHSNTNSSDRRSPSVGFVFLTHQVCQPNFVLWLLTSALVPRWLTPWRAVWASSPASGRSWRSGRQAPQKKWSIIRRRSLQVIRGCLFTWMCCNYFLLISSHFPLPA